MELIKRPRRLRNTQAMRDLVSEANLNPKSLVLPVFVKENLSEKIEISGMKNVFQHTEKTLLETAEAAVNAGLGGIMIFGIPEKRDAQGSEALNPNGILSRSVRAVKDKYGENLVVMADLCLDEFTSHGHCGILDENNLVDNDLTLDIYSKMAVVLAQSGVDVIGTSGMMDGQVKAVRQALNKNSYKDVSILAYAAKFASNFYGPFREAVESKLQGDRKTYQQDFRNSKESVREILLDIEEGADIVMVKPTLAYLDIIQKASNISNVPVAAYIVSGEMAMLEAAATAGHIDRQGGILEILTAVKRAGATIVLTYWAIEISNWVKK